MEEPKIEIERRFLLKELPGALHRPFRGVQSFDIFQSYLPEVIDNKVTRFRAQKDSVTGEEVYFLITKKKVSSKSAIETEEGLDHGRFFHYTMTASKGIRKIRFHYKCHTGLVWEIDLFPANKQREQLIIAEVELKNEDVEVHVPHLIQEVLVREITEEPEFSNFNLASKEELDTFLLRHSQE